MGGKKQNVNTKSVEAKARKEAVKADQKAQVTKQTDAAAWADEGSTAKEKRKQEQDRQRAQDAIKKAEKKALEEKDALSMEAKNTKIKADKRTQADLQARKDAQEAQRAKEREIEAKAKARIVDQIDLTDNMNHQMAAEDWAGGIDNALSDLSMKEDEKDSKPEKRQKAAYNKFCEHALPVMKADFPDLKHSQLKEKIWAEWQKSPLNPNNQA